ncbi:hypothetical protein [Kineococcus rubinsiae]|uniref:hypothetical protein n=1 Tax=Kineococcus rubinsiae TaxID=2609562 RepID=UPI00142F7813|nr:hypothetical protein [Kineococcus rubinsiae]NIZ90315.1 hypothetical protein [Kineococcus rubinsiae]
MTRSFDTTGPAGPGGATDPLARAVADAITGVRPPPPSIDLDEVRQRGRRRRTRRRTLVALPTAAALLVVTGALWTSHGSWTSTTQVPVASAPPASPKPAVPSPSRIPDPQSIATTVFRDALLSIDADLNRTVSVGPVSDGDTGKMLGWSMTYQDRRSTPLAALSVQVGSLADGFISTEQTTCLPQAQCTTEQLTEGIRLVTTRILDTRLVRENQSPGGELQGWHTSVTAIYPDGRVVSADTRLDASTEADLAPGRSFDSPLISTAQLRALATNPSFTDISWP